MFYLPRSGADGQNVVGIDAARGGKAEDHRAFHAPLAVEVAVLDQRGGASFAEPR